uniref:DNA gyrase subunit A n=1 Tax=Caldilinea aerophila TaxID=133453 RepID=A0A7C1FTR6_9CHLR
MERPDLSSVSPEVIAYIEALEARLAELQAMETTSSHQETLSEPDEAPTPINLITVSAGGYAKRTPRHLYSRQRRGGMGVFDLEAPAGDAPAFLAMAEAGDSLLLLTNQGRIFRVAVGEIPEREVRSKGEPLLARLPMRSDERLAVVLPDRSAESAFLVVVTERGQVRRIARQYMGASLQPGVVLLDPREGGAPAAACWSSGADDLFLVTRAGLAIRFAERLAPMRGCLGMRVDPGDRVVSVVPVKPEGGVFLLSEDGKGTIRLMSGFSANKSPGAGGKVAMKANAVVGATAVDEESDIFIISRLGKIIRFRAEEIPAKEGAVQGVHCMALRADECVALVSTAAPTI